MSRYAREIAGLDPATDFERIGYLLGAYEFAWDIEKALQFALFRTYAVPSISALLSRTGEFGQRPRKRYDDTELILAEIGEHGQDSDRGRAAIARMNAMHGRFRISNDDMRYVLSTFVMEPLRWIDRFGKRPLTEAEKLAGLNYYRALGTRMGISDLPETIAGFDALNRAYEAAHFRFAESNAEIGGTTRDLLLGFYLPRFLAPLGRPVVHALCDRPLRDAMGFADPPRWLERLAVAGLRGRARVLRWLPARRRPRLITTKRRATYPQGYRIEHLGTFAPRERPD
ncbi:oxygenase MpaB family protein [Roseisalinus antarcticus]|uniref:Uncharacterized protein n=1 Tax=Roseisalinus antarcticus TaxID=254357 RepID=A0A1Y5SS62_9RHOB|nr:oxygenase MpaB family protein [Roseisalinus antarcticus]SLN46522.1 hypothetical protein ROA7023_01926 [Roseisalinus antarcticus]